MKKIFVLISSFLLATGSLSAQKIVNGVLTIASGTNEIKSMAYYGNTSIKKVVIPSSVTKIGDLAFHGCSNLTEIDIPASVKTIGKAAFQNCTSLSKVTLHNGLTNLNYRLFKNTAIREITIPASVTVVDKEVFADCKNLKSINIDPKSKLSSDARLALTNNKNAQGGGQSTQGGGQSTQGTKKKASEGFILVEGGTFVMGNNSGGEFEKPAHSVTVSSFYMCDHEVTQEEYTSVTRKSNVSGHKGTNFPMEKVSWYDAVYYCNKLSMSEGLTPCYAFKGETDVQKWGDDYTKFYSDDPYPHWKLTCDWTANGYRLPTEAEWEWAARGGKKSKGYTYSGSNNIDEVAWHKGNSGSKPHAVKQKKANELGLYDMSGNVTEWCWDWFATYADGSETNPKGFSDGFYFMGIYIVRAYRGGTYESDSFRSRISARNSVIRPYKATNSFGFRVVKNVPGVSYASSPAPKKSVQRTDDKFVFVEGGTFKMGNAMGDEEERPVHSVTVGSFYMCDHELTQAEFKEIMRVNPGPFDGDTKPVWVNWYEVVLYCNLLSEARGLTPCYSYKGSTDVKTWEPRRVLEYLKTPTNWDVIQCDFSANGYRMPTEAEWEYAARGGKFSKGYKYSGSNNIADVAWYSGTAYIKDFVMSSGAQVYYHEPREVKTKKPNELGIYDMSGNFYEWCWDWAYWYGRAPENKLGRIIRGGGYRFEGSEYTDEEAAGRCTVTARQYNWPDGRRFESDPGVGVRIVRTATNKK